MRTERHAQTKKYETISHLSLGHTCLPMCAKKDCPDFDYFGKGCPGHDIKYFDDNDNEISKEDYDRLVESEKSNDGDILI